MWIGISKQVDISELEVALKPLVAPRSLGLFQALPEGDWPSVTATIETNPSEFPVLISFYTLGVEEKEVQSECIRIAAELSSCFTCRTICDGAGYGKDESPYWSIVWDKGESFLADDSGSSFGDGEGGLVKIVKKIHITPASAGGTTR